VLIRLHRLDLTLQTFPRRNELKGLEYGNLPPKFHA